MKTALKTHIPASGLVIGDLMETPNGTDHEVTNLSLTRDGSLVVQTVDAVFVFAPEDQVVIVLEDEGD